LLCAKIKKQKGNPVDAQSGEKFTPHRITSAQILLMLKNKPFASPGMQPPPPRKVKATAVNKSMSAAAGHQSISVSGGKKVGGVFARLCEAALTVRRRAERGRRGRSDEFIVITRQDSDPVQVCGLVGG
jgi:hypothetical protein